MNKRVLFSEVPFVPKKLQAGDQIPRFTYDSPYQPQLPFYELLDDEKPLFVVFMRNFGHPITRHYVMEYIQDKDKLTSARLACVVRTDPHVIAGAIPADQMPFALICDAEGVLYEHFCVPETTSWFRSHSLTALRILKAARKMGYKATEGETYQLPLTLLIDRDGTVLMAHYGQSLTDLPENCAAMEKVARAVLEEQRREAEKQQRRAARHPDDPAETEKDEAGEDWADQRAHEEEPENDFPRQAAQPDTELPDLPDAGTELPEIPAAAPALEDGEETGAAQEEPTPRPDMVQAAELLFGEDEKNQ